MRAVAGNSREASKKALLAIYRSSIRSVIDYGAIAYNSAVASPGFCIGVHSFGVVKRPKIIKYVVPPQAALYTPEYALLH